MKNRIHAIALMLMAFLLVTPSWGASVLPQGGATWTSTAPVLGPSWDGNPPGTFVDLVGGQVDDYLLSGGLPGNFTLEAGNYDFEFLYEVTAYASSNKLYWATVDDPTDLTLIFGGSASPGATASISVGSEWFLMIKTGGSLWFSSNSSNQFLAATILGSPHKYYVGPEDLLWPNSDKDNNDMLFSLERTNPVPEVPEPATMILFSTALLGLGFVRRKKKQS